jgi:hypothetical protein
VDIGEHCNGIRHLEASARLHARSVKRCSRNVTRRGDSHSAKFYGLSKFFSEGWCFKFKVKNDREGYIEFSLNSQTVVTRESGGPCLTLSLGFFEMTG